MPRLRRARLRRRVVRRAAGRPVREPADRVRGRPRTRPSWPACSRSATTRRGPTTRSWSWTADGLRASYRKIHLYDSFGYKESDRLRGRAGGAGARRRRRLPGRADDLLRPALPRAGPRAGRPRRRAARGARRLGRGPAARWTTGARWSRPGRSRTPRTSPRSASPVPATPATRSSSGRRARWSPRSATVTTCSPRRIDHDTLEQARATNPSLANRRF